MSYEIINAINNNIYGEIIVSNKIITTDFKLSATYNNTIGIKFISCTFYRLYEITELKHQSLTGSRNGSLIIEECIFKQPINISACKINLHIINTESEHILLTGIKAENIGVSPKKCSNIGIGDIHTTNLEIGSIIDKESKIEISNLNCYYLSLSILEVDSIELSNITSGSNNGTLYFSTLKANKLVLKNFKQFNTFNCSELKILDTLAFENVIFTHPTVFNFNPIGSTEASFLECKKLSIVNSSFHDFTFRSYLDSNHKIQDVYIKSDVNEKLTVYIEGFHIESLRLAGGNLNDNIFIKDSKVKNIEISSYINDGKLKLFNLMDNVKFSIKRSFLGKAIFSNINFSKSDIYIEHSQIQELQLNNIQWPDKISGISPHGERENYRQLKAAMFSHNNKVQAYEFEAKEMVAYKKELQNKPWYNGEKLILILSQTNNFGQDWKKATLWLLGSVIAMHVLSVLFINYNDPCIIISELWDKIEALAYFLNPIHPTKEVWAIYNSATYPDYDIIKDWFIFFDFIARLITAFFYFQVVKAFRKYAR